MVLSASLEKGLAIKLAGVPAGTFKKGQRELSSLV